MESRTEVRICGTVVVMIVNRERIQEADSSEI